MKRENWNWHFPFFLDWEIGFEALGWGFVNGNCCWEWDLEKKIGPGNGTFKPLPPSGPSSLFAAEEMVQSNLSFRTPLYSTSFPVKKGEKSWERGCSLLRTIS